MTDDIMIDLTPGNRGKRYKTGVCHFCSHDRYPSGKLIDPTTDHNARQMEDGRWKCGVCIGEETTRLLSLFGGNK
jgi:hypothetical protein